MRRLFYLYRKTTEDSQNLMKLLNDNNFSPSDCRCFIDSTRDFISYNEMKHQILQSKGLVFINSLHSIGYTKETVLSELEWFKANKIGLVIADMPSTWVFDNSDMNLQSIRVLIDFFNILKDYKNFDFQSPEFSDGGRKKIKFPENWESLYELYESKQITANEFQKRTGLKRATFFNLLSEYKEIMQLSAVDYAYFAASSEIAN